MLLFLIVRKSKNDILGFTKLVRWCNNLSGETHTTVILQPRHFPFLGRKEGKKMFLKQSDVKVQTGLKWVMTGSSGRFLITWIPSPSE